MKKLSFLLLFLVACSDNIMQPQLSPYFGQLPSVRFALEYSPDTTGTRVEGPLVGYKIIDNLGFVWHCTWTEYSLETYMVPSGKVWYTLEMKHTPEWVCEKIDSLDVSTFGLRGI